MKIISIRRIIQISKKLSSMILYHWMIVVHQFLKQSIEIPDNYYRDFIFDQLLHLIWCLLDKLWSSIMLIINIKISVLYLTNLFSTVKFMFMNWNGSVGSNEVSKFLNITNSQWWIFRFFWRSKEALLFLFKRYIWI